MTRENFSRGLLIAVTAIAALVSNADAQDGNRPDDDKKHPITITGCVRAGVEPGTFMLMNVKEIDAANGATSVPADEFGRDVLYILNSSKGLDKVLGRRVEVIGTVDLTYAHRARMKVTDDQTKTKDQNIEIKGDGANVTVESDTTPRVAPDAAGSPITSTEPNRSLYRLDVKSIRSVSEEPCIDRGVIFRRVPAL